MARQQKSLEMFMRTIRDRWSTGSNLILASMVLVFAAVGAFLLLGVHATTPTASIEAEAGTSFGAAQSVTDTAASGGQAIQFGIGSPSGQAMPVGNIAGWAQTTAQDFNSAASTGTGSTSFKTIYAKNWCGYDEGTGSKYYDNEVLSAHDGVMDFSLNGTQGAAGAYGVNGVCGQLYGRFSIRFKAVGASSYGTAIMVWPNSNTWGDGEVDYPEGDFDNTFGVNQHGVGCTDCSANVAHFTGTTFTNWHTATTEWTTAGVKYYLDDVLIGTVTHDIPINNHRMTIQMSPTHTPATTGHFLVDWIAIYAPS